MSSQPTEADNLRGILLMVLAMTAFTLNDTCMKALATDMPLFQAIFLRGVLTSLALCFIARRLGGLRLRFATPDRRMMVWRLVGETAGTVTFLMALGHMQLANLSAIMQSLPLAVTLAAAVFLGAPIGWRRILAIAAGFVGVLLIVRPGTTGFDRWALLGLLSVAFVVLRDLSTRQLSTDVPSSAVAFVAALAVTATAAIALPFEGWAPVSAVGAAKVAAASVFLVIGYLTVVMTMRVGDIALIAPFRYSALVVALVLGWAVFGQFPDRVTLAGAAIVIASGIYAFGRELRQNRAGAAAAGRAGPAGRLPSQGR